MSEECRKKIMSEEYQDYLVEWFISPMDSECEQYINSRFRVEYVKGAGSPIDFISYGYRSIPKLYGFMDTESLEASGILPLQRQPFLNLYGKDVLVGIVDTGIEYQNPLFLDESGRSRIAAIWDQTQTEGQPPKQFSYGREFNKEEIQEALDNNITLPVFDGLGDPAGDAVMKSLYEKTAGHGTFLAGVCAGKAYSEEFTGAVPEAELIVVKLKNAKQNLRDYYQVDSTLPAVAENDIMLGVRYLIEQARLFLKPMVILLGIGTNLGGHTGESVLCNYLASEADSNGIVIVVPAGNEAAASHHYSGTIGNAPYADIEFDVSDGVTGLVMELWSSGIKGFDVSIITPEGEMTPRIPSSLQYSGVLSLRLSPAKLTIQNEPYIRDSLSFVSRLRITAPQKGNWRLRVYKNNDDPLFHVWLPISGFLTGRVVFLNPDPYVTVTEPGNLEKIITAAAYRSINNSIYAQSGRGFGRDGEIKPDIAAPGADITGPGVFMGYPFPPTTPVSLIKKSGTSAATALTAGACAQLLEWAVVRDNLPVMNTRIAAGYLYTGANRRNSRDYPDREWGFGTLNIYDSIVKTG